MFLQSDHPHMEAYYLCASWNPDQILIDKDTHKIEHMEPMLYDSPCHSMKRYSLDHAIPHPASHLFKRHAPSFVWTHGL